MMIAIERPSRKEATAARATELLNHALRLEYAGAVHLPGLRETVQDTYFRYCLSELIRDATGHAMSLAAIIRELGGTPAWTVWIPAYSGRPVRLCEVQLARERICRSLYDKAALLLARGPLADRCVALAEDEDRHIKLVERAFLALAKEDELAPALPRPPQKTPPGVPVSITDIAVAS